MGIEYRKECGDKSFTTHEAYGRLWKCARKYRFCIFVGIACGMLTAGTLVPMFQVVQLALIKKVSRCERVEFEKLVSSDSTAEVSQEASKGVALDNAKKPKLEWQIEDAAKLPARCPKGEKVAKNFGVRAGRREWYGDALLAGIVIGRPRRASSMRLASRKSGRQLPPLRA